MRGAPRVLSELLADAAASTPDRIALVDEEEQLTYAELQREVESIAGRLSAHGVTRGDRVMLLMENGVHAAAGAFAALHLGAAFVFVNPQTRLDKLAFLLSDAAPAALLTELPVLERSRPTIAAATSVRCTLARVPSGAKKGFDICEGRAEPGSSGSSGAGTIPLDLAALIYTSGSTGRPKGVMMTHRSMLYSIGALLEALRLEEGMRTLSVLPFSFNYGMYQILLTVASRGTLFIERSFAFPAAVLDRMARERVDVFPGVPTIFARLVALHEKSGVALASVKRLSNTAAALSEDLVTRMRGLFPNAHVFRMYGLTECKRALFLEPERGGERPGSVGKAMPGVEAYLRSPEGQPVPNGEAGILHVRSPGIMAGYLNLPEDTAKVLIPGPYPGERVFVTGDWLRTDADGFFYFLGRSDDIIKTRGEKVSPAEVESILYEIPGMREACVVGVPDEILGEAVRAYVAFDPGSAPALAQIKRHCMERLEPFMVPRDIVVSAELPKTSTGKIDRKSLSREPMPAGGRST